MVRTRRLKEPARRNTVRRQERAGRGKENCLITTVTDGSINVPVIAHENLVGQCSTGVHDPRSRVETGGRDRSQLTVYKLGASDVFRGWRTLSLRIFRH